MRSKFRKFLLYAFGLAVLAAIAFGLIPEPVEVDLAQAERGAIRVTVDQDGKTRIREKYVVSAPLAGRVLRIDMDPGDEVRAGDTLLANIEPRDPELLDARTVAQAEARVKAAEATLEKMEPMLEEVTANQQYADSELKRVQDARSNSPSAVSESEVESRLLASRTQKALLRTALQNKEIARFELDQARAALIRSRPPSENPPLAENNGWNFPIRSPIDGRVLRVFQQSSAVVNAGTPLLEVGDPTDLEVEIDVLSRDAVKVEPGALVLLEHWGGDRVLQGRVKIVEPSAFTKISTLGVEEQRVNVIVSLVDPPQDRTELGDGFRVEARIVVAESADVLKVPTSALFRIGDRWAVFRAVDGVAREQVVEIGLENGLEAEIRSGLSPGDSVIVHPGDEVANGTTIRQRN
ncbi:efflux RND transporter periplasmic adaptor subunit [Bythopirellula polymerisocia]|uniref:Putative efflux system component YknX n=1 Tax=Bythopirellula polymerisocia TaxID=2528003 RepID=A0A5C6CYB6_9BACT|nr:HlyD family efflux transporter periplasmic adaptor subunit [Bythopirellula polymerisocia]TWU29612.1 putative efflux system component YknX [Bythopirellula polymerisocia]